MRAKQECGGLVYLIYWEMQTDDDLTFIQEGKLSGIINCTLELVKAH